MNWSYTPLSEERVVKECIKHRSEFDRSFYPSRTEVGIEESNGVFPFDEDILLTYIDLDKLIKKTDLKRNERIIIGLIMRGYTTGDIAERFSRTRQSIEYTFNKAVHKICTQEKEDVLEFLADLRIHDFKPLLAF